MVCVGGAVPVPRPAPFASWGGSGFRPRFAPALTSDHACRCPTRYLSFALPGVLLVCGHDHTARFPYTNEDDVRAAVVGGRIHSVLAARQAELSRRSAPALRAQMASQLSSAAHPVPISATPFDEELPGRSRWAWLTPRGYGSADEPSEADSAASLVDGTGDGNTTSFVRPPPIPLAPEHMNAVALGLAPPPSPTAGPPILDSSPMYAALAFVCSRRTLFGTDSTRRGPKFSTSNSSSTLTVHQVRVLLARPPAQGLRRHLACQ